MPQQLYVGIDVAKDELVVACCDETERFQPEQRFPNTKAGIAKLKRQLAKLGPLCVCLEPTSRYHLGVLAALTAVAGICVCVVNPYTARSFARSRQQRGKTDRVDAQALARFAIHGAPIPYAPPRAAELALRAISRRLTSLIEQRTAEKNRRHAASVGADPLCVRTSIAEQLGQLTRQIATLEQEALELIGADELLAARYRLLLSVKGIGLRSAVQLLGELGAWPAGMGKDQWVAMAGLDPKPLESGKSLHAPRHISRQGSVFLRRALYMPALCASQRSPAAQAYYRGLLQRGKKPLQALVALMRKLLLAIWGMFQSNQPFDPTRFYHQTA